MSKLVRLVDFQVFAQAAGLADGERRSINLALFSSYEPVRLWLKERQVQAPFRKIVVSLSDETLSAPWHGRVANAVGVCDVTEAVAVQLMKQNAGDHHWVFDVVSHALGCIDSTLHWRCAELDNFIAKLRKQPFPIVHYFEHLAKVDEASHTKCVPWVALRPGLCEVGLRFVASDGRAERDVTVFTEPEPLFLEDHFPLHTSSIRRNEFLLLDKSGKVLASAPIDKAALH